MNFRHTRLATARRARLSCIHLVGGHEVHRHAALVRVGEKFRHPGSTQAVEIGFVPDFEMPAPYLSDAVALADVVHERIDQITPRGEPWARVAGGSDADRFRAIY